MVSTLSLSEDSSEVSTLRCPTPLATELSRNATRSSAILVFSAISITSLRRFALANRALRHKLQFVPIRVVHEPDHYIACLFIKIQLDIAREYLILFAQSAGDDGEGIGDTVLSILERKLGN